MKVNKSYKWGHPYKPAAKYNKRVVYLSMEFGIDQALKVYSGGLGYLAGSHMRSAYQLKQNLIGVGMLWNQGYYDQEWDGSNRMTALFRQKYYSYLKDTGIIVEVEVKGHPVKVKAYYLAPETFGTVPMYFLTTDIEENDALARTITKRLYDSNEATRVAQNIVLGIGGAKVIESIGGCDIYHMNEAHALPIAFHLLDKYKKLEEVKKRLVFTTHTPVKAGNSVRNIHFLQEMGFFGDIPFDFAREVTGMHDNHFEYTPAALRMAGVANGVSQLHGEVAREMWADYEDICEIKAITNAQDEVYWTDKTIAAALEDDDDKALVDRKKEMKRDLFKIVANQSGDLFDENVLTIVWARRFAAYKRADLIMRDMDRFIKLLNNPEMPVQIIWAGKPYPEDYNAVGLFNRIKEIAYRHKNMAILTGYELELSAALKKGSDLWLNNPRRPKEASGTSGMTAAMNGSVNLSVMDGWIPEFAEHKKNAFVLPIADLKLDERGQDDQDHENLLTLLEDVIVPMYYKRPKSWIKVVKQSMQDVTPMFDSKRMADQYYDQIFNYKTKKKKKIVVHAD
jgi:starch phosphorylase